MSESVMSIDVQTETAVHSAAFFESSYEGRLERVNGSAVVGWAWDRRHPGLTVFVDIFVDEKCICTVAANEYRGDLKNAGKSDGNCAFHAPLPEWLCDGLEHTVRAVVVRAGNEGSIGSLTTVLNRAEPAVFLTASGVAQGKKNVFYPSLSKTLPIQTKQAVSAMIGKDDWLFLSHDTNGLRDQLLGRCILGAAQLDAYRRVFAARKEAFSKLGIPYVFAAAPTKEVIYDEFLPPGFVINREMLPLSQISRALALDGIEIFSLHNVLKEAKRNEPVYYRTDTHWNDAGNYAAYVALMERCQAYLPSLQIEPRRTLTSGIMTEGYRGDLANKPKVVFLGGSRDVLSCDTSDFDKKVFTEYPTIYTSGRAMQVFDGGVDDYLCVSSTRPSVVKINADSTLPKILIFHDSFMTGVIKFISTSFCRSVFVWTPEVLFDLVRREQPDIVLHMMCDRFMVRAPVNVNL